MSRFWILGASGQLGASLAEQLGDQQTLLLDRSQLDLSRTQELSLRLDQLAEARNGEIPQFLINATAYNQVDLAESERDLCYTINAIAPGQMAAWCASNKIGFVHYSTDYVYSGLGDRPWTEEDVAEPLNYYGQSKLEGERNVLSAHTNAFVFRTSWVYSHRRANFVLAILKRARELKQLTIVNDQTGSPTWAWHLAELTLSALHDLERKPGGIYNLCDAGFVSRLGFVERILEIASKFEPSLDNVSISTVETSSLNAPAKRPLNTRLSTEKAQRLLGVRPLTWQGNLERCLERYYA